MPTIYGQSVSEDKQDLLMLPKNVIDSPAHIVAIQNDPPPFNQFIQLDWAGIPSDHDHDDHVENDHRLQTKLSETHGGRSSRPLCLRLNFLTPSRCFNMRLKQRCSERDSNKDV